ncbi:hypothetical protein NEUTE1DRAFT_99863 [Neurospora tetrasperma FGSC 2508]|uniref:DUF4238 domain-containing protein n=1 Tax=Neurospora tetrasperma (strain FGSC 2508 / ATCC MYA-4615 / P0657) TaxID=510951 RepID=F8MHZ5_NEUT8|nr:uncharacterized protein NEUTE1DRAFT_99863 [Neurospora tetrasperma FGSC 2508]EGO59703.1 hypothetical protein NEUTE1DRAFT_99863 [Neurospora tetrasperma FGSC 2508]
MQIHQRKQSEPNSSKLLSHLDVAFKNNITSHHIMSHPKPKIATPAAPNGQYQHFVPQFLLKNFAHRVPKVFKKPKGTPKPKYEKGMYPGDLVLNSLNLTQDPAVFTEKPVSRIFGQINMYDDFTKPTGEQRRVEKLLSKLEAQAALIFTKITKAYAAKEGGVVLTRDERNLIRKFLYLMKYRSRGLYTRFCHDRPDAYSEDDQEFFRKYMNEHPQFKTPMQVWLHNIETIINLDMDTESKWVDELCEKMYYGDAIWFVSHIQEFYMALCVPSEAENEFILTDNSYSIYEGPSEYGRDGTSNKEKCLAYLELHFFAPVSPKIMVVLRSVLLPEPHEDQNPEIKKGRDFTRSLFLDPYSSSNGMLADLPVHKAGNSYSTIVDGRVVFQEGYDGRKTKNDKFRFPFFPIGSQHVNTINSIFFINCVHCTSFVFNSKQAFARTLEWYLTTPPLPLDMILAGEDEEGRLKTLKKLEVVSRSLGLKKAAFWMMPTLIQDHETIRLRLLGRRFFKTFMELLALTWGSSEVDAAFDDYQLLGGSCDTVEKDIDQVVRMKTLRIKIDSWSLGIDEDIRQRNRELLVNAYLRLPSHRLWLYIQSWRDMVMEHEGINLLSLQMGWPGKPERAIIHGAGSITKCGIQQIEDPARSTDLLAMAMAADNTLTTKDRTWTSQLERFDRFDRLELLIRSTCRKGFAIIMESERIKHELSRQVIEDLEKVLFTLVYPTPPPPFP